jgi:Tfp pilus assembly protein PilF
MFFVRNNFSRVALALLLLVCGCVQTTEHTANSGITIDQSLTYGRGLDNQIAKAREAVRENPADPAPHYLLAKAYLMRKNLDAAEMEFRTIVKLSPDSAGGYYELARIRASRGDDANALRLLSRAIELKPEFPEAHHAISRVYERLGNVDKARIHYEMYLELLEKRKAKKLGS